MPPNKQIAIVGAYEHPLLGEVRRLIREYASSLPFDLGFQGLHRELAELPGDYAPPRGRLVVARLDGRSVGCVALRPLELDVAELKRLWVRPVARGTGTGRLLVEHVVRQARSAGYERIRLDTTPCMEAAQCLYESLGFVEIAPYRANPVAGVRYLELSLRQ
jgi:putative acetyltransferase